MACTGGWDWAPATKTLTDDQSAATYSKGIWKSVYLLKTSLVSIDYLNPLTYY